MEIKASQNPQNFEKLEPAQEESENYILKSEKWKILPVLQKVYTGIQKYEQENKNIFEYVTLTQLLLFLDKATSDCALEFPSTLHGFSREHLHRTAEKYKLLHCSVGKAKTRKIRFAKILEVDYEEEGIIKEITEEIKRLEQNLSLEQIQLLDIEKKPKENAPIKQPEKSQAQSKKEEEKEKGNEGAQNQVPSETRKMPILKVDSKGQITQVYRNSDWKSEESPETQIENQKEFIDVPDPVENYSLLFITPTGVKVKWKEPSCNNSKITQYQVYLDNELANVTEKTEIELPKLTPDSSYTVHVIAENVNGEGYCTERKLKFTTLSSNLQCLKMNEKNQQVNQLKLYVWGCDRGLALGLQQEDRNSKDYSKTEKCIVRPHRANAFYETDVVGVEGGSKSTVVLDAQNQIIQFGDTVYSMLRLKEQADQADFNVIEVPKLIEGHTCKIRKVVAGQKFFMALSALGQIFTWGANSYATLGVQGEIQKGVPFSGSLEPRNISKNGDLMGSFIVDISCSYFSCLALTDQGKVVGWGTEALLIKEGFPAPSILTVVKPTFLNFIGEKVLRISSGRYHHAMVTSEGECHTFGSNNYLQLGYETEKSTDLYARKVPGIREGGWRCVDCACGLDFTIAVMKNEKQETKLLAWGRNKKGQCGVGEAAVKNRILPHECKFKKSRDSQEILQLTPKVKKVAAGEKHCLLLDEEGNVWSCGNSKKGQVGIGVAESIIVPYFIQIEGLGEGVDKVRGIAAGEQHSLAIVEGKRI